MKKILVCLAALLCGTLAEAKVTLPAIFTNNMVLQQQTNAAIWGHSDSKKGKVTIKTSWNKKSVSVNVDGEGNWKAFVETPSYGGPYTITISDGETIELSNVLIGEVWIASGQSNMDMTVRSSYGNQPVLGSNRDVATSKDRSLRLFAVERSHNSKPTTEIKNRTKGWVQAHPNTVHNFSATAYYFARMLRECLDIPVGIIQTSWGGTSIDCWMDAETNAKYADIVSRDSVRIARKQTKSHRMSGHIYNAMIYPLAGFTAKGFIWYQGCSDRFFYEQYADKMADMVALWRKMWGNEKMPFYYVQIAPYYYMMRGEKDVSQYIREQQVMALDLIPYSGMVCTADLGDRGAIHPRRKREVGERLAYHALSKDYGMKGVEADPPLFKSLKIDKNEVQVFFTNTKKGLDTFGRELSDFEVAGADSVYYEAKAVLKGGRVSLTCDKVPEPRYVRYGWKGWFEGSLFNCDGLPVSSFRTDNF